MVLFVLELLGLVVLVYFAVVGVISLWTDLICWKIMKIPPLKNPITYLYGKVFALNARMYELEHQKQAD